eukprot:CAMPEP_0178766616 /NCGR_PEP_ID=MMETSP0744-20121128/19167_1 /TAXON_ID=913974 /ORGANISM="Nitzschia punctata, Strain CCMP561" /LENGTH=546 /DNA_ID=CAMNT_0020422365 /DNA_START=19 /DNA_END=1659 /DNA_ORIENTATION=-
MPLSDTKASVPANMKPFEEKAKNHPVVAIPRNDSFHSYRGLSVRSSISTVQQRQDTPVRSQTPGRTAPVARSTSPGRSSSRSRSRSSRDIVQEVYDRMGVNYVRGKSCFEFDDNKSTISIHSGTKSVTKSPSRNRANAQYLHPPQNESTSAPVPENPGPRRPRQSQGPEATKHPVVAVPSTPGVFSQRRYSYSASDARDDQNSGDHRNRKENDDEDDRDGRQSPVSVKSRISAFSAHEGGKSESSVRAFPRSLTVSTSKQSHGYPPKINVYADSKNQLSTQGRVQPQTDDRNDKESFSQSVDESAGKNVPASRNGERNYHAMTHSQRSARSAIANSFLIAVSASNNNNNSNNNKQHVSTPRRSFSTRTSDFSAKSVPTEISPFSPNNDGDDHSIAPSSVSGEDFATTTKSETCNSLYGKNQMNCNTFSPFSRRYEQGRNVASESGALTKEMVEKMIDKIIGEKLDQLLEQKLDKMIDEKLDNKLNKKLEKMIEGKLEKSLEAFVNKRASATTAADNIDTQIDSKTKNYNTNNARLSNYRRSSSYRR